MEVGSPFFTTRMTQAIEERITGNLGDGAYVRRFIGKVTAIDASTSTATVSLHGGSTGSGGFKVRGLQMPKVDDLVSVCVHGQDRWVESILRGTTNTVFEELDGSAGTLDLKNVRTGVANASRVLIRVSGTETGVEHGYLVNSGNATSSQLAMTVSSSGNPGIQFGDGSTRDIRIQRTDYGSKVQLGISDPSEGIGAGAVFTAVGPSTSSRAHVAVRQTGDTDYRAVLTNSPDGSANSGGLLFGAGTTTPDVMLYRSGTNTLSLGSGDVLAVAGTQVLTSRRTGWGAPTGTPTRTTFATSTVTTAQLAERVKALIDDLTTHGMIGA